MNTNNYFKTGDCCDQPEQVPQGAGGLDRDPGACGLDRAGVCQVQGQGQERLHCQGYVISRFATCAENMDYDFLKNG